MANSTLASNQTTTFGPLDRETFLAAIARHRRASWRVTAACALAVMVLALVVAILMAPLLWSAIGLAADAANLITPTADVFRWIGRLIDPVFSSSNPTTAMFVRAGAIVALPGLAVMALATAALDRVWTASPLFAAGQIPGRPADRTVLAEERLVNIVEEMAIAAGVPPPRVVLTEGGLNAAACGRDQSHVTLIVGEALPHAVTREQLEGMIAHLIGSIANGDMAIGLRVTTTLSLFKLIARVGGSFDDRRTFWETLKLCRVFLAPTSQGTAALLAALADPFADNAARQRPPQPPSGRSGLTWQEWLSMPLMGPVFMTGFFSGFVCQFLLEPLIAVAWRQRKYMADATAVQLTRDPDGLAGALTVISERVFIAFSPRGIAPWTAHLAVAPDASAHGDDAGPFSGSIVPIFPSLQKRGAALTRMGAHVAPPRRARMPWPLVAILSMLAAIGGGLMLSLIFPLALISTMLSGLFTLMPAALLHAVLRWVSG